LPVVEVFYYEFPPTKKKKKKEKKEKKKMKARALPRMGRPPCAGRR